MTVQKASELLHIMTLEVPSRFTIDELRALSLALSVLDAQTDEFKEIINNIWDGQPANLSQRVTKP